MKTKKNIIILVGNIGCGKSTLCKEFVRKGYLVISRDSLRYMVGAGKYIFNKKFERAIWRSELEILSVFMEYNLNVVIDEVGVSRKLRMRYLLRSDGYNKIAVELPRLPMEVAVSRRMNDPHQQKSRKLWEKVWRIFNKMYESPTKKEGFDKVIRIKRFNSNERKFYEKIHEKF